MGKKKKSYLSTLKSKLDNLFLKLRSLGDKGEQQHCAVPFSLDTILAQQRELKKLLHFYFAEVGRLVKRHATIPCSGGDTDESCRSTQSFSLPCVQKVEWLRHLEDKLWFFSQCAAQCADTIGRLREKEQQVQLLSGAICKRSSESQMKRLEELNRELSSMSSRFTTQYNDFYCPYVRRALNGISYEFWEVMGEVGGKGEWDSSLSRVLALLDSCSDRHPLEGPRRTTDDLRARNVSSETRVRSVEMWFSRSPNGTRQASVCVCVCLWSIL